MVGECWQSQGLQISLAYYFAIGAFNGPGIDTSLYLLAAQARVSASRICQTQLWMAAREGFNHSTMLEKRTIAAKLSNKEAHKCGHPLTSENIDRHTCAKAQCSGLVQDFHHNKTAH